MGRRPGTGTDGGGTRRESCFHFLSRAFFGTNVALSPSTESHEEENGGWSSFVSMAGCSPGSCQSVFVVRSRPLTEASVPAMVRECGKAGEELFLALPSTWQHTSFSYKPRRWAELGPCSAAHTVTHHYHPWQGLPHPSPALEQLGWSFSRARKSPPVKQ